ncbi:hypothetical protein TR75_02175 [Hydrogenibacillus schlegelii]|uniref:Uncharacterized protein n=2 Tax=Hydrogenibacillus schlegelii TaxID=1484 RepID=A0A132NC80_HYDSH|nr:hypothetical protein TR75_02175 [Hydrogenibacillus schlegelii]OAR03250.1 hypothetical protein SA87_05060 [Hydrogenibacillus schlegelii]
MMKRKRRTAMIGGLVALALALPGVAGYAATKGLHQEDNIALSPDLKDAEDAAVPVQRTEVVPLSGGYKVVYYADIYGQKEAKWKEIYYDKKGNRQKEIVYDATGGEIVRLPEWTEAALRAKGLVHDAEPADVDALIKGEPR